MSKNAKVWSKDEIDKMSELRAFTQNGGDVFGKIIDISMEEKKKTKN